MVTEQRKHSLSGKSGPETKGLFKSVVPPKVEVVADNACCRVDLAMGNIFKWPGKDTREARNYLRSVQPFEMRIQLIFSASGLNGSVLWQRRVHWARTVAFVAKIFLRCRALSAHGRLERSSGIVYRVRSKKTTIIMPGPWIASLVQIKYLSNSISTCSKSQIPNRSAIFTNIYV